MAREVTSMEFVIPSEVAGDQELSPPGIRESEYPDGGPEPQFRSDLGEIASTYGEMTDEQLARVRESASPTPRRARPEGEAATPEDFRRTCITLARSHLEATEGGRKTARRPQAPPRRRVVEDFPPSRGRGPMDDEAPSDPLEAAIFYAGLIADCHQQARELLAAAADAESRLAESLLDVARLGG